MYFKFDVEITRIGQYNIEMDQRKPREDRYNEDKGEGDPLLQGTRLLTPMRLIPSVIVCFLHTNCALYYFPIIVLAMLFWGLLSGKYYTQGNALR